MTTRQAGADQLFGSYPSRADSNYDAPILQQPGPRVILEQLSVANVAPQGNPTKTQTPRAEVDIFNLRMSHRTLRFTDERMWKFLERAALFVKSEDAERNLDVYGEYIRSINPDQEQRLRTSLGLP
jgi:hypothetical protein